MRFEYPEDALELSHPARVLWDLLGKMDLSAFSKGCEAVEGAAGRSLKSPRMLLLAQRHRLQSSAARPPAPRLRHPSATAAWAIPCPEAHHQPPVTPTGASSPVRRPMAAPSHSVLPRPEPVHAICGHIFCGEKADFLSGPALS